MKRLVYNEVWNRLEIEMPDIESVLIAIPSAEAVSTNTKQISADISTVPRNSEKLIQLRMEIPPLLRFILRTIDPDKTR